MCKMSIVVPVYNVEQYVVKCLESLVNQTLKDIEIIVVNDGATDGSQAIIDEFVANYPKLVQSLKKEKGGLSDARNFGIPYCKGEYIGFVDSDDYIALDMYEKMYSKAKKEHSDIVVCDYYKVYLSKREVVKAKKYADKKDMFIDTLASACNKIYRRELIIHTGVLFPKGLIYEDTEFFCKLIPYVEVASYVPEPLVYYVQRRGSISNTQGRTTAQIFKILDNILRFYKGKDLFEEYFSELEYFYVRIMLGSSMGRICRIKDKRLRKNLLRETYELIISNFPSWKENKYLNGNHSKRHLYMRNVNKANIGIFAIVLNIVFAFKARGLN